MATTSPEERIGNRHAWLPAVLAVIAVLAYLSSFSGAFVFDDPVHIHANPHIQHLWPPWDLLQEHRPVVALSLAVNYAIGKFDVFGYHLFNLTVHILAGLTLYGVVRRTFLREPLAARYGGSAAWLALAVASIWVVHPLQTQAVTYIIQRGESLMGLFYLLTLYCVIRGLSARRPNWWYAGAVISCALGMGSKAVMISAPLVVFLYDVAFGAQSTRRAFRQRWGLYVGLLATGGILVATGVVQGIFPTNPSPHTAVGFGFRGITPLEYALTQPGVIVEYLKLSFWPHPLCLDHAWPVAKTAGQILPFLAVVVALLGMTVWAFLRRPGLGFLGAWFFLILAPTSSVIPIRDPLNEHRMYLPLAAVLCVAVVGGYAMLQYAFATRTGRAPPTRVRQWATSLPVIAVVAVLGWVTFQRNRVYASELSVWRDVVAKAPHNARAHLNLGAATQNINEAIRAFREAARLKTDYVDAYFNLARAYTVTGRTDEAIDAYRLAIHYDPQFASAHLNLGNLLSDQGRTAEAMAAYQDALEADPTNYKAHQNLGADFARMGKLDEAIHHFQEVVRLAPTFGPGHLNLAMVLARAGWLTQAAEEYEAALRLLPRSQRADPHYRLGELLRRLGRVDDAVKQYEATLRLAPGHPRAGEALEAIVGRGQSGD
ncbi:MAG: tetratricopeptide repeat protein [Planctomycetes bacterium]|nr:tetratricopeptide repeat protein [Planctomycetota bacterium]